MTGTTRNLIINNVWTKLFVLCPMLCVERS